MIRQVKNLVVRLGSLRQVSARGLGAVQNQFSYWDGEVGNEWRTRQAIFDNGIWGQGGDRS